LGTARPDAEDTTVSISEKASRKKWALVACATEVSANPYSIPFLNLSANGTPFIEGKLEPGGLSSQMV